MLAVTIANAVATALSVTVAIAIAGIPDANLHLIVVCIYRTVAT
jgi:hypothetical protein